MIKAERMLDYAFQCSRKCIITLDCDGKMIYTKKQEEVPPLENTIDFQVFKVQELDKFTPKNRFYAVEVEGKLVDSCSIGDTVYVLGTFETRNDQQTKEIKRYVIRGIKITKAFEWKQSINSNEKDSAVLSWIADKKRNNDNELEARDEMLKGVAPELNNCFILKLALLVVLCTGGRSKHRKSQRLERMTNRDISHILFIGLPGLGEFQKAMILISI
jgi:DNA replicative helicase MCM subunit Mcm2 (Cdc46/Mcm family)